MAVSKDVIEDSLIKSNFFAQVESKLNSGSPRFTVGTLSGVLRQVFVSALHEKRKTPVLVLFSSNEDLDYFASDLEADGRLTSVVMRREDPTDLQKAANDNTAELDLLDSLSRINSGCDVILAHYSMTTEPLPPVSRIAGGKVKIRVGDAIDFEAFRREMIFNGFEKCDYVSRQGEIATRGGIIDIFPAGMPNPVRIECWGDEIDSIREFDLISQRSIRRMNDIEFHKDILAAAETGRNSLLADYLPAGTISVIDSPEKIKVADENWEEPVYENKIIMNPVSTESGTDCVLQSSGQPAVNGSVKELVRQICSYAARGYRVLFSADGAIHTNRLRDLIENAITTEFAEAGEEIEVDPQAAYDSISWLDHTPEEGFASSDLKIVLYTEHRIFNRRKIKTASKHSTERTGISLRELKELVPGDYVVHADKGIGRFVGIETVMMGGVPQDCVKLSYEGGDNLYVHLNYIHKIQKYSAAEGTVPKLSKLGTTEWERKKARTKKKLKDIARDLIKIYAKRKASPGFAYPTDTVWQKEFEASFMFEDTPDQSRTTDEVKADMEAESPMDRLVCGDVGFGKTEIAIRAAFKAAQAGRQTAVLVPTTILAQQHYESFRDRMHGYPINIAVLSRFRTKKEQEVILENIKTGKCDILIGTHRILSKDIDFKNLGLLIIDEEHRFGVSAKEKLRELRANIDTLTLTATPIPRTLNFSLMGARDLSLIETPPRDRLPVDTKIIEWKDDAIAKIIDREMNRRGQIYFVHDKVKDIEQLADRIRTIAPLARVGIVHGQLPASQIEKEMEKFIQKKYDILVATKIIESGLDIPNANTIIINRAQNFGLAELYQLRGRVGRSNTQAYCRLVVPNFKILTNNIIRRLQAIEEFTDLGSGFKLAMRDMEIRGAGNLLGGEQSGFIIDIGYEMFNKILDEAVQELRYEEFGDIFDKKYKKKPLGLDNEDIAIDLYSEALIPAEYIESEPERFSYYRKMYNFTKNEEVKDIRAELEDRFGKLPPEVEELLFVVRLRIAALGSGFRKITVRRDEFIAEFPDKNAKEYYETVFPDISDFIREYESAKVYQKDAKLFVRMPYDNRDEIIEFMFRVKKTAEVIL